MSEQTDKTRIDIFVHDPKKRAKVAAGYVIGDTYYRDVKPKHLMRIMSNSYGIQESIVTGLAVEGVTKVCLMAPDAELWSDLSQWLDKDIRTHDWGHGIQRFLPQARMRRKEYEPCNKKTS